VNAEMQSLAYCKGIGMLGLTYCMLSISSNASLNATTSMFAYSMGLVVAWPALQHAIASVVW